MTLGGLLKHVALVEDSHFAIKLLGQGPGPPWDAVDWEADPDDPRPHAAPAGSASLTSRWSLSRCRAGSRLRPGVRPLP